MMLFHPAPPFPPLAIRRTCLQARVPYRSEIGDIFPRRPSHLPRHVTTRSIPPSPQEPPRHPPALTLLPPSHPAFLIKLSTASSLDQPCSTATSGRYVAPSLRPRCVKLMRRPWVPRVQSSASAQGSKFARRVRLQEREGRRARGMGWKRVSSKAEVRA